MPSYTERPGYRAEPPCGLRNCQHAQQRGGDIERFHQTWNALVRQLNRINFLAHLQHPQQTEAQEAVSIAKHLLDKLGTYPELVHCKL